MTLVEGQGVRETSFLRSTKFRFLTLYIFDVYILSSYVCDFLIHSLLGVGVII